MHLTAARLSGRRVIGVFALLLLIMGQLFVSHTGMVVSNNIYAATLTLYTLFLLVRLEAPERRPLWIAPAGLFLSLGAGVKANFFVFVLPIAITAFVLPACLAFGDRVLTVVLPLAIGGVVGAVPTLTGCSLSAGEMSISSLSLPGPVFSPQSFV